MDTPTNLLNLPVIIDEKPTEVIETIDVSNFSKSAAELIKRSAKVQKFYLNGCTVTIPAESSTVNGTLRFLKFAESLRKAMYKGLLANEAPKDDLFKTIVRSFKNVGIDCVDLENLTVETAIKNRTSTISTALTLKKSVINAYGQNKVYKVQSTTFRLLNKIVKTEGIKAAQDKVKELKMKGTILIGEQ